MDMDGYAEVQDFLESLVVALIEESRDYSEARDVPFEIAITMLFGLLDVTWETSVEAYQGSVIHIQTDEYRDLVERRMTLSRIASFHKLMKNKASLQIIADELKEANEKMRLIAERNGIHLV